MVLFDASNWPREERTRAQLLSDSDLTTLYQYCTMHSSHGSQSVKEDVKFSYCSMTVLQNLAHLVHKQVH